MGNNKYVIGIDFGTDSVRAVIFNALDGKEISSQVTHFKRWMEGKYCNPSKNQFRQHPLDYIESLAECVSQAVVNVPEKVKANIVGIGVDTTGSTIAAVDEQGAVLSLKEDFKDNPNAMFVLWKDHTAVKEAADINRAAKNYPGTDFTKYVGGVYSSEWFWSKILHILRNDEKIRKEAYSWVEHTDWITGILTGNYNPLSMRRSRAAAGHKAMWNTEWGGLPPEDFLVKVDSMLSGLRKRLYTETYTSDKKAGYLTENWAKKFGLKAGIRIASGSYDAHLAAVGSEIEQKAFLMILGTSACDMVIAPYEVIKNKLIKGICGQVDGSIIPGMVGLEAGQSSFGDVYAWFKDLLAWPFKHVDASNKNEDKENLAKIENEILANLEKEAEKISPKETGIIAIDWLNGRRTPFADQELKGAIIGLSLGSNAPKIYRALVESTAFGAKAIIERFEEEGIELEDVIAGGGIPKKAPFVMQVISDVLNRTVRVTESKQVAALGAAMSAATAAGIYKTIPEAQKAMGSGYSAVYHPDKGNAGFYGRMFLKYKEIGRWLEDQLKN